MSAEHNDDGLEQLSLEELRLQAKTRADAKVALAKRFFTGEGAPLAPPEALKLLIEANELGNASAPLLLSALVGMGAGAPQSWPNALGLLCLSAERGLIKAQEQLRLLVMGPRGEGPAALAGETWRALGRRVDTGEWTEAQPKLVLAEAPRIRRTIGFLSPEVCRWIIGIGEGQVAPALVYDAQTGGGRTEEARSNSAYGLKVTDFDLVLALVRARISAATGSPIETMEPPQLLHYDVGQKFELHYDFLDVREPGYAKDVAERGQRVITFLIYLNEAYSGGETEFPKIGLRFKGNTGDGLFFASVDRQGVPEPLSMHAGRPPLTGQKWVFSQWIRNRTAAAVG